MIRWTGLAPWEFESPFPGSLTSTFLVQGFAPKALKMGIGGAVGMAAYEMLLGLGEES